MFNSGLMLSLIVSFDSESAWLFTLQNFFIICFGQYFIAKQKHDTLGQLAMKGALIRSVARQLDSGERSNTKKTVPVKLYITLCLLVCAG